MCQRWAAPGRGLGNFVAYLLVAATLAATLAANRIASYDVVVITE
jgi:hypothetical protein